MHPDLATAAIAAAAWATTADQALRDAVFQQAMLTRHLRKAQARSPLVLELSDAE